MKRQHHGVIPLQYERTIEGVRIEDLGVYEYLKSVREEAESAGFKRIKSDLSDDDDDIYIAPPSIPPSTTPAPATLAANSMNDWKSIFMKDFLKLKSEVIAQECDLWPQPGSAAQWRRYITENPPIKFDIIQTQFDHATCMKLLVHFTSWLSSKTNDNFSQWIYVMFLRIDNVLEYSDSGIIRQLGKKALRLLDNPETQFTDTSRYTCEFIVLIVVEYYNQRDLASPI